jgi:predicted alpha/beta-fold hydrolase
MPIIKSKYKPPFLFKNKHLQSIFPTLFRKVKDVNYSRERIYTPDDDFLDLDWSKKGNEKLIVLVPGLESSSRTEYIQGMIHVCNKRLWSAVVFNPRGLSGEANNQLIQYHAGKTDDFHFALEHIVNKNIYKSIVIAGFSFGANMILKYLGEDKYHIPKEIKKTVCASVICDITASADKLGGTLYFHYFMGRFKKNIKLRMEKFPEQFNLKDWNKIKNFRQYVERYVTAYNEFRDAADYWYTTSCMHFLKNIKIPTLIINAKDDPFLTEKSYPVSDAENNHNLYLELPDYGGHTGFILFNKEHEYYLEKRFVEFIKNNGF